MKTEDFFKFLIAEDMTPEQKQIFDLIQSERRMKAHYQELSQELLKENDALRREQPENSGYERWSAFCAGAVATPAVLRQLAALVGPIPVTVAQKIEVIKQLRRHTGLNLLESKLAADYLIDCEFDANSLPNQDTQYTQFMLVLSSIRRGLFVHYMRYRGLDVD